MSVGIRTHNGAFVASKKAIKEIAKTAPEKLVIESYSPFGTEYFTVETMPVGRVFTFAGPDPFRKRAFYGNIVKAKDGTVKVS